MDLPLEPANISLGDITGEKPRSIRVVVEKKYFEKKELQEKNLKLFMI